MSGVADPVKKRQKPKPGTAYESKTNGSAYEVAIKAKNKELKMLITVLELKTSLFSDIMT